MERKGREGERRIKEREKYENEKSIYKERGGRGKKEMMDNE